VADADVSKESSGSRDVTHAKRGPLSRLALFIRQVIVELRKVIWPTRKELIAYTVVVIVFVSIMAAIVAGFDYVFTQGVLAIFG
jgi:preprotein translocase subunit SecE